MAQQFTKYEAKGAYHWRLAYHPRLRRYDPRTHARYDVPLAWLREAGLLDPGKIGLEIGCGDGVFLYKAALAGARVVGLDASPDGLRLAVQELRERTGRAPLLVKGSGYDLPFGDGALDFVASIEVIEHLDRVDQYLREIRRVLKPGGRLVLTTPHRSASGVPEDPFHVREYSGPELRECLQPYFTAVDVRGMGPAFLDRIYLGLTHRPWIDKLVRGAFKVTARFILNPYAHVLTRTPGFAWSGLVAMCTRP